MIQCWIHWHMPGSSSLVSRSHNGCPARRIPAGFQPWKRHEEEPCDVPKHYKSNKRKCKGTSSCTSQRAHKPIAQHDSNLLARSVTTPRRCYMPTHNLDKRTNLPYSNAFILRSSSHRKACCVSSVGSETNLLLLILNVFLVTPFSIVRKKNLRQTPHRLP